MNDILQVAGCLILLLSAAALLAKFVGWVIDDTWDCVDYWVWKFRNRGG